MADAWTGNSRFDPKTQKAFTDTMTVLMGRNAFPNLVRAEKLWQAGVSIAKNTIVIRSMIVPASNLMSNFLQLMSVGVGPRDIARGFTTKLVEIDQHLKNLQRRVEIKALKARHHKDPVQLRKLEAEDKLLDDASRRLSIWPLIEAGEFSTISEGLTEADAAIAQGKWADWIQAQVDRLPAKLGAVGRYAVITRDTAPALDNSAKSSEWDTAHIHRPCQRPSHRAQYPHTCSAPSLAYNDPSVSANLFGEQARINLV